MRFQVAYLKVMTLQKNNKTRQDMISSDRKPFKLQRKRILIIFGDCYNMVEKSDAVY